MQFKSLATESKSVAVVKNRASVNPAQPVRLESARQNLSSLISAPLIQPKLKIGTANDKYEREADRVADQVMTMPDGIAADSRSRLSGTSAGHSIQRLCSGCQQRHADHQVLQPRALSGHTPALSPNIAGGIQSIKGNGQPLAASARGYFEPRFGRNFSQVRIHDDNRAASLADSIGARAFTLGQDVVFGDGQHQPDTREGRRLLAHELAHTVQQGGGSGKTSAGRLSHVESDRIQKEDDDDEERRRRRSSSGSGWQFQFGLGPMRAPSPSGPAASFFPPTEQLPIPGFLLNRGLGFQYGPGGFDFGVFLNLGGNTDFYGTRDIPRLLNPGSSQQTPTTPLPQIQLPGQQTPPINPNFTTPIPQQGQTPTPGTGMPPQPMLGSLRESTIDRFVLNRSTLPTNAAAELDSMAVRIRLARPAIVWVTGHTDASGTEQHNQTLSEARAATVRQALIARGVDASIIETSGEGESNPSVMDATTADQHARNRRVTIEWFDPMPPATGFRLQSPWLNP